MDLKNKSSKLRPHDESNDFSDPALQCCSMLGSNPPTAVDENLKNIESKLSHIRNIESKLSPIRNLSKKKGRTRLDR